MAQRGVDGDSHLDLSRVPYGVYGVKYIDLVSLGLTKAPCCDFYYYLVARRYQGAASAEDDENERRQDRAGRGVPSLDAPLFAPFHAHFPFIMG